MEKQKVGPQEDGSLYSWVSSFAPEFVGNALGGCTRALPPFFDDSKGGVLMLRIAVDFNTMQQDTRERVSINTVVDPWLLQHLHPGLSVILYEPYDMEVDAVVEFDEKYQSWFGVPNWSTRRDLPADSEMDS